MARESIDRPQIDQIFKDAEEHANLIREDILKLLELGVPSHATGPGTQCHFQHLAVFCKSIIALLEMVITTQDVVIPVNQQTSEPDEIPGEVERPSEQREGDEQMQELSGSQRSSIDGPTKGSTLGWNFWHLINRETAFKNSTEANPLGRRLLRTTSPGKGELRSEDVQQYSLEHSEVQQPEPSSPPRETLEVSSEHIGAENGEAAPGSERCAPAAATVVDWSTKPEPFLEPGVLENFMAVGIDFGWEDPEVGTCTLAGRQLVQADRVQAMAAVSIL